MSATVDTGKERKRQLASSCCPRFVLNFPLVIASQQWNVSVQLIPLLLDY